MYGCGQPLTIAHGNWEAHGSGAVESVTRDVELGADGAEVDVRATRDGAVVVSHDDSVRLKNGDVAKLAECTVEELDTMAAPGQLGVSDNYRRAGDVIHNILSHLRSRNRLFVADLKDDASVAPFFDVVREHRMEAQVIVTGCEDQRASDVVAYRSGVQVLLNEDVYKHGVPPPYPEERFEDLLLRIRSIGCGALNMNYRYCHSKLVDYLSIRMIPIAVWTIDDPERMAKYVTMGVHSISTNNVRALVDVIHKGGL